MSEKDGWKKYPQEKPWPSQLVWAYGKARDDGLLPPEGFCFLGEVCFDNDKFYYSMTHRHAYEEAKATITHWRPLPQPPEEEKEYVPDEVEWENSRSWRDLAEKAVRSQGKDET